MKKNIGLNKNENYKNNIYTFCLHFLLFESNAFENKIKLKINNIITTIDIKNEIKF